MKAQVSEPNRVIQVAQSVLKVLSHAQVRQIDQMLSELGPYGELHLIVRKGKLRFIEKVESFDFSTEA
jgi:hypothetical protein